MNNDRLKQIPIYVGKHFRLFISQKGWKVILFAAIIAGLVTPILGSAMFVYNYSTASGNFALVCATVWIGIFNSIETICKERAIVKREHRTGLHISSYVISHMIFQVFICFIEAVVFLGISVLVLKYPKGDGLIFTPLVEYFITYFLLIYSADVLGLMISAIVRTPETAMTIMPFVLIVQLMFSGMLFNLSGAALKFGEFTLSKWGLNATCTIANYNALKSNEEVRVKRYLRTAADKYDVTLTDDQMTAIAKECLGDTTNKNYIYTKENLLKQWRTALLHIVAYGTISIVALEFVDKDKR